MTEPHPLNCETCKHRDKYGYGWCPFAWEHVNPPNTVSPVAEFTKRCGCASHSSAKESSDKVLEELEKWALQEARTRTLKQHGLAFVEMQAKIEELRTKERERMRKEMTR